VQISDDGSSMIIPREVDLMRMYVQLGDTKGDVNDGNARKINAGSKDILETAVKTVKSCKLDFHDVTWWTVNLHQDCAQERVFIVGDTCHTTRPTRIRK